MVAFLSSLSARWSALGAPRERRVVLLLFCVLVLSAGDLYMTLTHLTGPGMLEGNPLARGIMGYNSPAALAVWKTLTVGLGLGILFFARRTLSGEVGAWVCCAILAWLTVHWTNYNNGVSELTPYLNSLATSGDVRWVQMQSDY